MKRYHAVALALVGWYLMLPPIVDGKPDVSASLSTWEQWRAFDTADLCETEPRLQRLLRFSIPPRLDPACR
jgi:hypothetical protein